LTALNAGNMQTNPKNGRLLKEITVSLKEISVMVHMVVKILKLSVRQAAH
jgi:hypothetical protein